MQYHIYTAFCYTGMSSLSSLPIFEKKMLSKTVVSILRSFVEFEVDHESLRSKFRQKHGQRLEVKASAVTQEPPVAEQWHEKIPCEKVSALLTKGFFFFGLPTFFVGLWWSTT